MPPTRPQPVTKAFLTRALDRSGVPYRRDCDGDLYTIILSDERPKEFLQVWFLLEGETRKIFELRGLVQPPLPWQNLGEAMILCHRRATPQAIGGTMR